MKAVHILGIVFVGIALAFVVSLYGNPTRYVSFPEAKQLAAENPDREYHVVARLDISKEMVYNPKKDPNYFAFFAIDSLDNPSMVVYRNAKPQDIERTEKVVLIGNYKGDHFEASSILSKCPSKYNEELSKENLGR
jgi:cytochrome c-type biogenesis protein CcmE